MRWQLVTTDKKFAPFFWTQFLGAFNDNFFKNALVVIVAFRGVELMGLDTGSMVAVASGMLMLPFILFSGLAGQISDKYEKSLVVRVTKICEILIMLCAALGFLLHSYSLLLFVLFLMGAQSAFFGPIKYSIILDLVGDDGLVEGNALTELGTFLSVLLGTLTGGLVTTFPQVDYLVAIGLVMFAVFGFLASRGIPVVPIGDSKLKLQWNPIPEIIALWRLIIEKRSIWVAVVSISWFWFFGAAVLSVVPVYVKSGIYGNEQVVTLFLALFSLGVGIGSICFERFAKGKLVLSLVPLASIGMTLFAIDLYWVGMPLAASQTQIIGVADMFSSFSGCRIMLDFFFIAVCGGLFIVPLYCLMQEQSHRASRARVIAGNNIMNAIFIVAASGVLILFYTLGFSTFQIFAIFGMLNLIFLGLICIAFPDFIVGLTRK